MSFNAVERLKNKNVKKKVGVHTLKLLTSFYLRSH